MTKDSRRVIFIPSEKLGAVEDVLRALLVTPQKKARARMVREIRNVFATLRLISAEESRLTLGIAFGALATGETGVFVTTVPAEFLDTSTVGEQK